MKNLLKLEEAGLLLLSLYLFLLTGYPWWLFMLCFLLPDLSMTGYMVNTRIGAVIYNVVHHRGVAVLVYITGILLHVQVVQFIGIILFAHGSFDRILGYGLKYGDNFKNTHLGVIGGRINAK